MRDTGRRWVRPLALAPVIVTVVLHLPSPGRTCTSIAVSPRAAEGGRALLWKHRDTKSQHNEVLYLEAGRYDYVGVINAGDEAGREIWMGVNAKGLAVINTASDDLVKPEEPKDGEGRLLKLILQSCASVADVEKLLRTTDPGGRDVTTNIGVLDADGHAVYFEVGQKSYRRFDADDRKQAPEGYVLRTNFAFSAPEDKGGGYLRFDRASALFAAERKRGRKLSHRYILAGPSLDLANARTGVDPRRGLPASRFVDARDTINRSYSVSDAVFVGRASGEPAHATTMWVALGQPIASLAVPVWPVKQQLPETLNGAERAELELLSDQIRLALYPEQRGNLKHYIDATKALQLRQVLDVEQQRIFDFVDAELRQVREHKAFGSKRLAAITCRAAEMARVGLIKARDRIGVEAPVDKAR